MGKNPWYPLDGRLGGSQSCSGCGGDEEIPVLLGIKHWVIQLID